MLAYLDRSKSATLDVAPSHDPSRASAEASASQMPPDAASIASRMPLPPEAASTDIGAPLAAGTEREPISNLTRIERPAPTPRKSR
jgi:hypothetical protein